MSLWQTVFEGSQLSRTLVPEPAEEPSLVIAARTSPVFTTMSRPDRPLADVAVVITRSASALAKNVCLTRTMHRRGVPAPQRSVAFVIHTT